MKTTSLVIAAAVTLAASSAVLASDKAKEAKDPKPGKETKTAVADKGKNAKVKSAKDDGRVEITGSYIKQKIRRSGRVTDGFSQVVVLDRDMIEQSGAADLKQLLAHQGLH